MLTLPDRELRLSVVLRLILEFSPISKPSAFVLDCEPLFILQY